MNVPPFSSGRLLEIALPLLVSTCCVKTKRVFHSLDGCHRTSADMHAPVFVALSKRRRKTQADRWYHLLEGKLSRAEIGHISQPLRVVVGAFQKPSPQLPVPSFQACQLCGMLLRDGFDPSPRLFLAHPRTHLGKAFLCDIGQNKQCATRTRAKRHPRLYILRYPARGAVNDG